MSVDRFTATKLDADKPPMDLIPWEAMSGVAQVLDFGRQKYAPHNWRKGFLWCRLASAALRHVFAWLSGEDKDPESGFSHIDHALCCLMFLSAHIKSGLGEDDRACKLLTDGRADTSAPAKQGKFKIVYKALLGKEVDASAFEDKRYCSRSVAEHELASSGYPLNTTGVGYYVVECDE